MGTLKPINCRNDHGDITQKRSVCWLFGSGYPHPSATPFPQVDMLNYLLVQ